MLGQNLIWAMSAFRMLRDLNLKPVYKSDQDNILEEFYLPALSVASSYDRAVGFFSGSALIYAAQAISAFVQNDGKMRLVLGAFVDKSDLDAVLEGLRHQELADKHGSEILRVLGSATEELFKRRFECISYLVAHGRLEIRIALREIGMYHDKVGIIRDAHGNSIVFSGSANESASALLPTHNYESISVFPSWRPELEDFHSLHADSFERLWTNRSPGTAVLNLPAAVEEQLIRIGERVKHSLSPSEEASLARYFFDRGNEKTISFKPKLPAFIGNTKFDIRDHQKKALNNWKSVGDFHGIFDLATGAGKTITALYGMTKLSETIEGLATIIAVPYQNLADQWCESLNQFGIEPIRCYQSQAQWLAPLTSGLMDLQSGRRPFLAAVVVNRTLNSPEFQNLLGQFEGKRLLWIGDECHHHGSRVFEKSLPDQARHRMGLSATPMHYIDEARNERLTGYYGSIVATYSLKNAIDDKILTPYEYYPMIVELTDIESLKYKELSDRIAQKMAVRMSSGDGDELNDSLTSLLTQRSRLIGSAHNKLARLKDALAIHPRGKHTLFYCGDGRVSMDDEDELSDDVRQIEAVSQVLSESGWRLSRFTSRESPRDRADILGSFEEGSIDAMVAIKCLDEGIDIPACQSAYFLASSSDPRQFIQRRGRILRRSKGKDKATIVDFVVVPNEKAGSSDSERKLLKKELARVAEFASLSLNRAHAYRVLEPLLKQYGLEHLI